MVDSTIYLPLESVDDFACYTIYNEDTIRAYSSIPESNSTSNYVDFYINSHYLTRNGTHNFSQYSTLPECIDNARITVNISYRNDIADILIIFFLIVGFIWFIINSLIKTLLKGRKRY